MSWCWLPCSTCTGELGWSLALSPVEMGRDSGLRYTLGKGQGLSRAIPRARRSPGTVREQWWAGKDGVSVLAHWYLPFSGSVIAPAWQKSVLGAEPAGLGQALFSSSLWSSC